MEAEVGRAIFFTESEAQEVFAFLKEEEYTPDAEGMRQFLLECARDDGEDDDEEEKDPMDRLSRLMKDPRVQAGIRSATSNLGPLLQNFLKTLGGKG